MKVSVFFVLGTLLYSPAHADNTEIHREHNANADKKIVTLWYEAFTKKDPTVLDKS